MAEHKSISEITVGEKIVSVYLLNEAQQSQTRDGRPYWKLVIQDAGGTMPANMWSPYCQGVHGLKKGQMVYIEGIGKDYQGSVNLNVINLRVLDEHERNEQDMSLYITSSVRQPADMLSEIEDLCDQVLTHHPWHQFVHSVLTDADIRARLLRAPAARSVHQAYVGGLLEHTLAVSRLCMSIAGQYPGLDRQVLLAAAVLHDIGKIYEIQGMEVIDLTDEGKLLGHIVQGLLMLEPFLKKSGLSPELIMHFRHLIISHHGKLEFGAPKEPATPEAFILHFADNIDSKIGILQGTSYKQDDGDALEWSPRISSLNYRSVCRPVRTPEPEEKSVPKTCSRIKNGDKVQDRQCSLL